MSACRECIFLFLGAATCETYSLVISLISENKLYRLQQGKRTCNAHKIPARSCFLARDYARLQSNVSVREYLKWRTGSWLAVTLPLIPSAHHPGSGELRNTVRTPPSTPTCNSSWWSLRSVLWWGWAVPTLSPSSVLHSPQEQGNHATLECSGWLRFILGHTV